MKQRLKVFLTKHSRSNRLADTDLIKYPEEEWEYRNIVKLSREVDNGSFVYIKQSRENTPRWFSEYLGMSNSYHVTRSYAGGFFFRTIEFNDEEYKFAITFSGAENQLVLEHFMPRFGLKIALNSSDNIYSINKKKISDTQASITENAIKGQIIDDFTLDFEKDLLYGVVVQSIDSDFSVGKISGRDSVAFTTDLDIDELDNLLEECLRLYQAEDYKERFDFIDNIQEISHQKTLKKSVFKVILDRFLFLGTEEIWFAQAEDVDWEKVGSYRLLKKNTRTRPVYKDINDLDYDQVYNFIIDNQIIIDKLTDFKQYSVEVYDDSGDLYKEWSLFECIYASVEYDKKHYVLNAGKLYEINKDFYEDYNEQYKNLTLFDSYAERRSDDNEPTYNKYLYSIDTKRFVFLDGPKHAVHPGKGYNQFEVCDIFDNQEKIFLHIKKYASSSVLSHLFAQARISAILFKDPRINPLIVAKMNSSSGENDYTNLSPDESKVVVAIITDKELPEDKYLNIPFFSKVNAVKTLKEIKNNLGYKDAGLMFIETI